MISVILPTYRNPKYLDLCLTSAVENKTLPSTQIIVVVDGFVEESRDVLAKYQNPENNVQILEFPQNMGMSNALNYGVWNSETPISFIINDDNVFPTEWDLRLEPFFEEIKHGTVVTVNQIEPEASIFGFPVRPWGLDADEFKYQDFLNEEPNISKAQIDNDGRIFPFLISKKLYMAIGGFDTYYQSPFYVDVDFWLKLELLNTKFYKIHHEHLYHFGSRATKLGPEGEKFRRSEGTAAQQFQYKWGYVPNVGLNTNRNNTKYPEITQREIRGVTYI